MKVTFFENKSVVLQFQYFETSQPEKIRKAERQMVESKPK